MRWCLRVCVVLCGFTGFLAIHALAADAATQPAAPSPQEPTTAPSHVAAVTVYQGTALVGRDVSVPEESGSMELLVTPLPPQTVATSLYTEGADGLRVLSTRFRSRAVQADTRAEVRTRQDQILKIQQETDLINRQIQTREANNVLLGKLENFTSATLQTLTDKGCSVLNRPSRSANTSCRRARSWARARSSFSTRWRRTTIR
jgi:N-terminal domain of unknown function (DUF4140)